MSQIESIQETINTIRDGLKKKQRELNTLISNPVLIGWYQLDLKKSTAVLKALGLSTSKISTSITTLQQASQKINKDHHHLSNELGNIQADLTGNFNKDETAAMLKKASTNYETIKNNIALTSSQIHFLVNTNKHLTDNRHIEDIFTLARKSIGGRTEAFDNGLKTFKLFFQKNTKTNTNNILHEHVETANKLTLRFESIELPKLPCIAIDIIEHHIALGRHTAMQISLFANAIAGRFVAETGTKNLLSRQLKALEDDSDITTILLKITTIAKSLGELILYIFNKKNLLEQLPLIPETFDYLNAYHLFIKNNLLQQISSQIETIPAINPTIAAEKSTKTFFYGIKGMMRSFKLMYSSLKGKEAVNEVELQLILEEAINSCRIFYGDSREDIHRLKAFINNLLKQFARPFPYNQLFKLTKTTIAYYGNQFEAFILKLEVEEKYCQQEEPVIPKSFSKLVEKIHQKDDIFTKFVSSLNKNGQG